LEFPFGQRETLVLSIDGPMMGCHGYSSFPGFYNASETVEHFSESELQNLSFQKGREEDIEIQVVTNKGTLDLIAFGCGCETHLLTMKCGLLINIKNENANIQSKFMSWLLPESIRCEPILYFRSSGNLNTIG
jgi:hypothetical protein